MENAFKYCNFCKKIIKRSDYSISKSRWDDKKYCSRNCTNKGKIVKKSKRKLKTRRCLYCKKEYTQRYNCSENEWFRRRKYCCRECCNNDMVGKKQSKEQSEKRVKTLLNNGKKRIGYNYYKQKALDRDNYTCVLCGYSEKLIMEVDHIKQRKTHPYLINKLDNLMTLCPNCHRRKTLTERQL